MKAVVTGGLGFIGSHLVDKLIGMGWEVWVIDDMSTGNAEFKNEKADYVIDDCQNAPLLDLLKDFKPDYVFHLAALARIPRSLDDPIGTTQANVMGTLNMLNIARKVGAKRFIYSSSSSVYGKGVEVPVIEFYEKNPASPYALQKYIGELLCKQYSMHFGLDTVCLRYFNVYGPRQTMEGAYKLVIGTFLQQLAKKEPLTVYGDGMQTRDFTWVDDVVDANILSTLPVIPLDGMALNIGSGVETSISELAGMISSKIEYRLNPRTKFEELRKVADVSLAKLLLGWEPTVLIKEGIERLLNEDSN